MADTRPIGEPVALIRRLELNTDLSVNYISVGGIRTRYIDQGEGPVILLIHGGHSGMSMPGGGDGWAPVIAPLVDKGFRVVTFDKLGQGETDLAPTHAEWTFDAVVKHARGFIDALGLEDMILVGHSRGGLLASKLALDMPESTKGLFIVSSATLAGTDPKFRDVEFYDAITRSLPADASPEEICGAFFRALYVTPVPQEQINAAAAKYVKENHQNALKTYPMVEKKYWEPSLQAAKDDIRARLFAGEVNIPVEVVWGRDDRSAPVDLGIAFYQKLALVSETTSLHILGTAGHFVFAERTEDFVRILADYAGRRSASYATRR